MLGTISSCALLGIDAYQVVVEVDITSGGLPTYHVVGLPAASVKEGAVRIRAALAHVGQALPRKRITINLAPADQRKDGAAFDLPIALAVLTADGGLPADRLDGLLVLGELGLEGSVRPIRGALAAALLARHLGKRGVLVPAGCADEAAEVEGIEVYSAGHIGEVLAALRGERDLERAVAGSARPRTATNCCMSEVRGQDSARLALEVAVAGGHNILMVGAPGIGKTMLARRIPTILPPLQHDESLETTRIYSAVGLAAGGLVRERPFRAPHHTITTAALIGGGSPPRPGEVSLAHNGVLFLDELPEFGRAAIESMRQPLEDRQVTIGRATGTVCLPASFLLAASANPCPCGWLGSEQRTCTCGAGAVERYRHKMSGPLLDRIDLQVFVPQVTLGAMRDSTPGETSEAVRGRVEAARDRQRSRLAPYGVRTNGEMPPRAVRATCKLKAAAERELERLCQRRVTLTGRGMERLIKVARTIADLDGVDEIGADEIREAACYRALDSLTPMHAALTRELTASSKATATGAV